MFENEAKAIEPNHSTKAQVSESVPYRFEEIKAVTAEKIRTINSIQKVQIIEFGIVPSNDVPT